MNDLESIVCANKLTSEERRNVICDLRQSMDRLQIFERQARDVLLEFGRSGRIRYVSENSSTVLGRRSDELIGTFFSDWLHPDDGRNFPIGDVPSRRMFELRLRHADTTWHWFSVVSQEAVDRDGFRDCRMLLRDVTNFRRLEEELALREAELGMLKRMNSVGVVAASVAHDLNNALTCIFGFVELASKDAGKNKAVLNHLNSISQVGENAKRLVRRILDFGRSDSGKPCSGQLGAVLRSVISQFEPMVPKSISLEAKVDESVEGFEGDQTDLHEIISNLVSNAIHAIGDHQGRIRIRAKRVKITEPQMEIRPVLSEGDFVKIEVSDNGHGMSSETVRRIFEYFFTTKETGKGTGLGLGIVYRLVVNRGGGIRVESQVGRGSVFEVFLPFEKLNTGK